MVLRPRCADCPKRDIAFSKAVDRSSHARSKPDFKSARASSLVFLKVLQLDPGLVALAAHFLEQVLAFAPRMRLGLGGLCLQLVDLGIPLIELRGDLLCDMPNLRPVDPASEHGLWLCWAVFR